MAAKHTIVGLMVTFRGCPSGFASNSGFVRPGGFDFAASPHPELARSKQRAQTAGPRRKRRKIEPLLGCLDQQRNPDKHPLRNSNSLTPFGSTAKRTNQCTGQGALPLAQSRGAQPLVGLGETQLSIRILAILPSTRRALRTKNSSFSSRERQLPRWSAKIHLSHRA
jgi:hypothetical protein